MGSCAKAFQSVLLAIATLTVSDGAFAHSLGHTGLAPPLRAYFEEAQALDRDLKNGITKRGVLDQFKLWPLNTPVIVCFNNGNQALRDVFVEVSLRWLTGTSLTLDFGSTPGFRACAGAADAHIRVSFNPADGHWSYLGTDSLKYKTTTLNIGYSVVPAKQPDRKRLEGIILHEVGHAIGLDHEHQSPEAKCEEEFDWPKIYHLATTQWGLVNKDGSLNQALVDFNFRVLTSAERLRATPYDRASIMHYSLPPVLFKSGKASTCFVDHNDTLSPTDKQFVRETYPPSVAAQDDHLQKRADVASVALAPMKLSGPELSRVGRALVDVLARTPRKIILSFNLAPASGKVVTRGSSGDFTPCDEPSQPAGSKMTVACEVAADASALLVGVEPK